ALFRLAQHEVLDPAPAMAADVEARRLDGRGGGGVAFERQRAAEHRHRQAALLEGAHQAPEAGARAVLEHALGGEVAALHADLAGGRFSEAGFAETFAVLHRGLRAFLVVHHGVDRDPGAVRPFRIGRILAVAHQIACWLPGHVGLLTSSAPIWRAMSAILSFNGSIEISFTPARRQASA